MSRVRVQCYKPSKSARALARYLGVKRIKTRGSRFRGRPSDVIINWGNVKTVYHNSRYLNPIESVKIAANKLATFEALNGLSIPSYTSSYDQALAWLLEGKKVVIRSTLYGHSGRGIKVVDREEDLEAAPLYTILEDKVAEYRAIVVNGKVVDVKEKKKKREWEDERDPYIWNHGNGYVFARDVGDMPCDLASVSIEVVERLGLITGAVDIIKNSEGKLKVLEINTAYGLEGTTVELVGDAIREVVEELKRRH